MSQSLGGSVLEFDTYCAVVRSDTKEVVATGITPMAAVVEARIKLGLALNQEVLAKHVSGSSPRMNSWPEIKSLRVAPLLKAVVKTTPEEIQLFLK